MAKKNKAEIESDNKFTDTDHVTVKSLGGNCYHDKGTNFVCLGSQAAEFIEKGYAEFVSVKGKKTIVKAEEENNEV